MNFWPVEDGQYEHMNNRTLFWIGGILAIVVILVYWTMLPPAPPAPSQEAVSASVLVR